MARGVAVDIVDGLSSATGIKGPCAVATTANVTLSGEQTIDGVTTDESRVLVKDQTDASENGIYVTSTGAWRRAKDFSRNNDVRKGSAVYVTDGAGKGLYVLTTENPITIGDDDLVFEFVALAGEAANPPLTADRTYYVDEASGDDDNDGLTEETAFATGEHAAAVIADINFGAHEVTLVFLGATATGDIYFTGIGQRGHADGAFFNVQGEAQIDGTIYAMAFENCPVECFVDELTIGEGGIGVGKNAAVQIAFASPVTFEENTGSHIFVALGGDGLGAGAYTIAGGGSCHVDVLQGGRYRHLGADTITLTGSPEFATAFARANALAFIGYGLSGVLQPTFSGAAVGVRFIADLNGVIDTGGAGDTYLPGDDAGVESNGGKYV